MAKVTVNATQNVTSPSGNSLAVYVDANTNIIMIKDVNGIVEPLSNYITGGGGGGDIVVSVTYAEAQDLIDTSALKPGTFYLITDFQTIYDQPDFDSDGNPKTTVETLSGPVSPIFIQAATETSFFGWALQPEFANDKLQYDFSFNTTEIMAAPAKGRITERIDNNNNRTDYDHRVVLFKRYLNTDTESDFTYNLFEDNGEESVNYLTFNVGDEDQNVYNDNYIGNYVPDDGYFLLSNNVFFSTTNSCITGIQFLNNSIYAVSSSSFDSDCEDNLIYNDTISNSKIGVRFRNNIMDSMEDCIIGNNFRNNTTGEKFESNSIGHECLSNTLGGYFSNNKIADNFRNNTIGEYFFNNTIADNFRNNTTGENIESNSIGNGCIGNTIGTAFSYNTVGVHFNNNEISDNCQNNSIGNDFISNTIGDDFSQNTIGINFSNNQVDIGFKFNSTAANFNNNVIGKGFSANNIAENFQNNPSIGDNFQANNIEFEFANSTIGINFQNNTIYNQVEQITTTDDFRFNIINTDLSLIDFTGATHVYQLYTCNLITDSTFASRLYIVISDVFTFFDITD